MVGLETKLILNTITNGKFASIREFSFVKLENHNAKTLSKKNQVKAEKCKTFTFFHFNVSGQVLVVALLDG